MCPNTRDILNFYYYMDVSWYKGDFKFLLLHGYVLDRHVFHSYSQVHDCIIQSILYRIKLIVGEMHKYELRVILQNYMRISFSL